MANEAGLARRTGKRKPGQNKLGPNKAGSNKLGPNKLGQNKLGPNKPGSNQPGQHKPKQNKPNQNKPAARGGRPFRKGDLRQMLLSLIAPAPTHGYEMIRAIAQRLGGQYTPSPGVVYPTLSLLEDLGHIACTQDGTRKLYSITEAGMAELASQQEALTRIEGRMASFTDARATPITGGMEALRAALRKRLAAGLTPPEVEQAGHILREAAQRIGALELP